MRKLMEDVVMGGVTYYIVGTIFNTLITGTSDVDSAVKILVPLGVGIAVLMAALKFNKK
jgi:hypothetical protein